MSTLTRLLAGTALLTLMCGTALGATQAAAPALSPLPQGAEVAFVRSIQKDLGARFATVEAAERAGYFRYTDEDDTGAISYADLKWHSSDPRHPSQLWYDVHGNLLGADFSVPRTTSPDPPQLWGVSAQRWTTFRAHIHYVLATPSGGETYGATGAKKFAGAGGAVRAPQAQTLVKMGIAASAAEVRHVFLFPAIWDLIVWIKPNPSGAFAQRNPAVAPSAKAANPM